MLERILRTIDEGGRFVLTSHARPDGDAIGSVLACCEILKKMGKSAEVVLADRIPYIYRPLPFTETVVHSPAVQGQFDAAIILECDSLARTRLQGLEERFLINIDHHLSGKPFAHLNWIDPTACATAEMIFRLAREAGVKISAEIATCLYTAVLTDTGSFCFPGTSERTFALAQELVRAGADPVNCAHNVYFANPTSKMRLLGAALSSLHRDGDLAWMHLSRSDFDRCGAFDEDAEGLVNYALSIASVEVAILFRELPERRFRVSLRSKGKIDVAAIAERFGGGGHECASGCALDGPLSVATERILAQIRLALHDEPAQ